MGVPANPYPQSDAAKEGRNEGNNEHDETLRALGHTANGGADIGEVVTTAARPNRAICAIIVEPLANWAMSE
jgi:hypothetical protein